MVRDLDATGHEVHLFAAGGSLAPERGELHLLPGGYGDPLGDGEHKAFAWYRDALFGCDVVFDCSDQSRIIEQLYLTGGAPPYAWWLRTADGGPRFGRRNAVVADPELAKLHPWARVIPGMSADTIKPMLAAVAHGKRWEEPRRLRANPGRLLFMRWACEQVGGRTLNVGCGPDPAGLRARYRATNMDLPTPTGAEHLMHATMAVRDVVHDMTETPWPFGDNAFDLVVLGDVLEDLPDDGGQVQVLAEAHRVARCLCATWPVDGPERDPHHRTTITADRMRRWLRQAGWWETLMVDTDYVFVPLGHMLMAKRAGVSA